MSLYYYYYHREVLITVNTEKIKYEDQREVFSVNGAHSFPLDSDGPQRGSKFFFSVLKLISHSALRLFGFK